MKTYIADIIPKIKQFSRELNDLTLLEDQHWVIIDEATKTKQVFIFRKNSELLIATNGRVKKGKWEYLDNDSLLIQKEGAFFLLKHGFLDSDVLSLRLDSQNEFVFFVNESKYGDDLDQIGKISEFLRSKYLATDSFDYNNKKHTPPSSATSKSANTSDFQESCKLHNGHIVPPAIRTYLLSLNSWLGEIYAHRINFQDNKFGFIYCSASEEVFFEYLDTGIYSLNKRAWYQDFETAISALHFYLIKGKLTPSGFVRSTNSWTDNNYRLLQRFGNGLDL